MFKQVVFFTLWLVSSFAHAEQPAPFPLDWCVEEAPYGFPKLEKENTTAICRKGYVLLHDNEAKIPAWVSYTLRPIQTVGCNERNDSFAADASLRPEERAEVSDYSKSGYDTGHIANDGDFRWDKEVSKETFILSNMTPQLPGFNRGIWKKLEDTTRGWALSRDAELLIYAGPIYETGKSLTIGENKVVVPRMFYKIITDTTTNQVMSFLFEHEPSKEDLPSFLASVAQVQQLTGITFPLPKGYHESNSLWPRKLKSARTKKRDVCMLSS